MGDFASYILISVILGCFCFIRSFVYTFRMLNFEENSNFIVLNVVLKERRKCCLGK